MKYKLLRYSLLSLLVMLCGNVFAQEPAVTLDFTDKTKWDIPTDGTNTEEASFTNGTYSIKLCAANNYKLNTGYLIMGKKGSYLELPAFDFDVSKIVLEGTTSGSASVKQNFYVGDKAVSAETTGVATADKNPITNTYVIADDYQAAGNVFKLLVTSAHNTQIAKIHVYKKDDASDTRFTTQMTLNFGNDAIPTSGTAGEEVEAPTPSIIAADGKVFSAEEITDLVTWSTSDANIAEWVQGKVILRKAGTATLTATFAGDDTYKGCSASYEMTVNEKAPEPDEYNYVYQFNEKELFAAKKETKTLNSVEWSLEVTCDDDNGYFGWDSNFGKGHQFGSGKKPMKAIKLFTEDIPGKIKKILVNTSGASGIEATMTVTVGKDATKFTCGESESINLTMEATDYVFTGEASGLIVLTYEQPSTSKAIYIKTIKILYEEGTTPDPEPDTYTVTFEKSGAEGEAPAAIEVNAGEKFKIPANRTMYKSGYTLTGWTDGENTYKAGDEVEPTANMTLSPVFTENMVTLADRTARTAIDFELDGYYDNPRYSFEGKSGIMVTQAKVNDEWIDVKADVDAEKGKFVHNGSGWHQVNSGTKVIVPSCKGAEIIVETYNDAASVDFNGVAGTAYDNTVRYVAESDAETLTINQISNNYWQKLSIFLAKPEQGEEGEDDKLIYCWAADGDEIIEKGGKAEAVSTDGTEVGAANGPYQHVIILNGKNDFSANTVTITLEKALKAGDKIAISAYRNKNAVDKQSGALLKFDKGGTVSTATTGLEFVNIDTSDESAADQNRGTEPNTVELTVPDAADGSTVITMTRAKTQTNLFITKLVITGERGGSVDPDPDPQPHDPVELVWDYTEKNIPTSGPDNGLYYASYVNDAAGTNMGLHGVKLNSSGYAFFEKPAVAGTLTLTISNRKNADAFAVNVYACTIAEGAATKGDLIGEVAVDAGPGTGSIDIAADVTGIYIERKTTTEGVLQKIVFKEKVARTFVDFEITNDQLKGEFDASTLPAGVTFTGTQRNDNHGYGNVTIKVPVDGTVKFTIGGCQYASPATCKVTNAAGELLAEPNLKTATCYHQDGAAATYIYIGEPTTLTFSDIAYLPYFKAEATEVSEATITYKDQNGNELGTKNVYEGDPIGEIPYTEADLTIPEGMKFRGWIYSNNIKVKATDIVTGNVTVKASVTAIEEAPTVGSIQTYDLTQSTFYPEDHENFGVENAAYYNNHGFNFNEGGSFTVNVTGKAQIVLTLCQYGNGTTIQVLNAEGAVVSENVPAKAETDGGTAIVNYEGPAGMLKFTFATQTFLHKVTVYNVSEFLAKDEQSGYYIVPAGDAAGLVMALNAAATEADSKIFLPNGTYDLGEATLTTISGKNVSIIGQSMEGVIIKNAPDVSMEGLGKADLFNNTAEGLYMQDLTLQNALDYYKAGTGRAPTLHDQGTKTINKNVRHLSYQDTYYSHKVGGLYYFEGGEIHGTVDYLCGNGKVYFNEVKLINEQRSSATITANSELYVFNKCTVDNNATTYNLGRAWSDNPICVYLNTTLLDGGKSLASTRWNLTGINCDYSVAGEYNTMDAGGNNITPSENIVTFTKQNTTLNTILSAEMAARYSIENVLGEWAATAQADCKQVEAPAAQFENGNIVWEAVAGATAYAIFKDDALVAVTTETSILAENDTKSIYTIRSANARGGFGAAAEVTGKPTSINTVKAENGNDVIYNLQGVRVEKAQKGLYIVNGKKVVVK